MYICIQFLNNSNEFSWTTESAYDAIKEVKVHSVQGLGEIDESNVHVPSLLSSLFHQFSKCENTVDGASATALSRLRLRQFNSARFLSHCKMISAKNFVDGLTFVLTETNRCKKQQ